MWPFDRLHKRVKHFKNRPLRGNEKVAIMLLSVAPQLAATVYKHLTPEQIREINTQMTKMVYLEDSQRIDVISTHMGIELTTDLRCREDLLSVVIAALEAYIRSDSRKAAHSFEILLDNWPRVSIAPIREAGGSRLSGPAEVAVLFMALPPELSAQLFSELRPESIQKITIEIARLPVIDPQTRSQVIRRFLELERQDIPAKSLLTLLASVISQSPSKSAARIVESWPEIG